MENLTIQNTELWEYFKSIMPELLFVTPYCAAPTPPRGTPYFTAVELFRTDVGFAQEEEETAPEDKTRNYNHQLKLITVQFDFMGRGAGANANLYKQLLKARIFAEHGKKLVDFKGFSPTRNLTFLDTAKTWIAHYNFDAELYIVDSVSEQTTTPPVETAEINLKPI